MDKLPIELIEIIALNDNKVCLSLMLVFRINRFYSIKGQKILKKRFTKIYKSYSTIYDGNGDLVQGCEIYVHRLPNGWAHRDDGPAAYNTRGEKLWYKDGKLHRDHDYPALEFSGLMEWWKNGIMCRDNDKPTIYSPESGVSWWGSFNIDMNERYIEYLDEYFGSTLMDNDMGMLYREHKPYSYEKN